MKDKQIMNKIFVLSFFCLVAFCSSLFADNCVGFWKTIDDKTGHQQSIVAIYKYKDKYYGRLILSYNDEGKVNDTMYNPKSRAPGVKGNPYYSGMDIIWDLIKQGSKYTNGWILDPEHGKIYDAEMWVDNGKLVVRGEILFLGRNQTWTAAVDSDFPPDFKKPDLTKLVPLIPKVND